MSSAGTARATVLALALASGAISPASAVEPSLDGAWVQDGSCDETFVRAGKGISFKKPINVFAPALIITGNRLRTPTTSCTIKAMKPARRASRAFAPMRRYRGGRRTGKGAHRNVLGRIARPLSLNEQGTGAGSSYKRCTL